MVSKARGGPAIDLIRRSVSNPLNFEVQIAVDRFGCLHGISLMCMSDHDSVVTFVLKRALAWLDHELSSAAADYLQPSDILAALPVSPMTLVERAILQEIAAVQAIRCGQLGVGGA